MLALKVVGALGVEHNPAEELHVSCFLQTNDARHVASARTGAATRAGSAAVWNEELLLPIATDAASSVASVLLELRSGPADGSKKAEDRSAGAAASGSIVGFATIEWSAIYANASGDGWAVEPPLLSASGTSLGGKLLVRLLFTDAAANAQKLRELKAQLSDAMSTASKERMALSAATEQQVKQLAQTRSQLGLKLHTVTTRSTEKEVSAFRNALEARLSAARKGRDSVLHNYSDLHQQALGQAMPKVAERLQRSSQQQHELIERVGVRAHKKIAAAAEVRHQQWAEHMPQEREQTVARLTAKTKRAAHRIHAAFHRAAAHEGSTLGRRLRKIAHEAEERAARECTPLHKQSDAQLATGAAGRAEVDAEARETANAVRMELGRLASEWLAGLSAHYASGREQLGRQLLDFQAAHRDQRAARRVVDAAADNERKAALSRRANLLTERSTATQKEVDALGAWLSKRLEAAQASAATVDAAGSLGRPVDASPRRIEFEAELADVRSRAELQRGAMQQLYTRLFVARAHGAASEQVAEVMKACEARGLEIMADTSKISSSAVGNLQHELSTLAAEVARRHDASLLEAYSEAEGYERALLAPSLREAPKHAALLSQLSYELQQSLQLALSRPAEWFEILSRALKLDEATVAERDERLRAAMAQHANELSAQSGRAAEEVATEEELMLKRERQLTADAQLTAERIASERRTLLADQGTRPDVAALMRAAFEAKKAEGEQRLLERKRGAAERLDLPHRPKHHSSGEHDGSSGGIGDPARGSSASGVEFAPRGTSLDARRRTRGFAAGATEPLMESGLPGRLRDHYHQLLAEAAAYRPEGARVLEWSEEAAAGDVYGLSHSENDRLLALEAALQAELRDAVLREHATFAQAASELGAQRDALRASAAHAPFFDASALAGSVGADREVERLERKVESSRAELLAATATREAQDRGVSSALQEAKDAFTASFEDARRQSSEAMQLQLKARDEAGEDGASLRAAELTARDEMAQRRLGQATTEWDESLESMLGAHAARLEPVRKRLASAKRSLASELLEALRRESDARAESHVKHSMRAAQARLDGRERLLSALVATHEEEAASLAKMRTEQLDHVHGKGDWDAGGFLATLMSVGAIKSNDVDMKAVRRRSVAPSRLPSGGGDASPGDADGSPSVQRARAAPGMADLAAITWVPPKALAAFADPANKNRPRPEPRPLRVPETAISDLAAGARKRFDERPEAQPVLVRSRLQPKRVRASGPMAAPPLPTIVVDAVLSEVESALGDRGLWAAPSLHSADKMPSSIKRAAPPVGMPSAEEIRFDEEEMARLSVPVEPAAPTAMDDANARKRAELVRTTMMHSAQKRSLEAQAEEAVAEARRPQHEAARELADLQREEAAAQYQDEELQERRQTAEVTRQLVAQVEARVQGAGTGHMRSARLWAEALIRRQAEETTMHARRLRQEAHAAASSKLGAKGEDLKHELAGVRSLIDSVKGALAASAN